MPSFLTHIGAFFMDLIETIAIALSIFLVVYLFLLQPHQVDGKSMYPNFESGEYLLTDKISYDLGEPERGDVVVFHAPPAANCPKGTGCDFIKRIIGLPGESVEIRNNMIYVNAQLLKEPYLPERTVSKPGSFSRGGEAKLGPDEYFVCGDNRNYSSDSRAWGPIKESDIVGRAFFRYWPPEAVGPIKDVSYNFN